MNILLWILQVLIAVHTGVGAIWKFSKTPEETMPSLKAIPSSVWMGMSILEILIALALILPAFNKSFGKFASIAAILIIIEMLAFSVLHISSGDSNYGPILYWLIIALICGLITYGRLVLKPFAAI